MTGRFFSLVSLLRSKHATQASRSITLGLAAVGFGFSTLPATDAEAQLMVIAPHPDDDALMAGGVIERAVQAGVTVQVVYLTNGDYYGYGYALNRQDEAVAAEQLLGVPENRLIFLGYPDGGLNALHNTYTATSSALQGNSGLTTTFGDRGLGGTDYHHYVYGTSAKNNGANLRADLQHVLSTYQPTNIIVTSEYDAHDDHAYASVFLHEALNLVAGSNPSYNPTIYESIVWPGDAQTAWPNASDPTTYFAMPPLLANTPLSWSARTSLDVPVDMQESNLTLNVKARAIDAHQSQGGVAGELGDYVHKDEFFWSHRLSGSNQPTIPNAGVDQNVTSGAPVTLSAVQSSDPNGTTPSYQWRQIAGPAVTLSSTSAAQPTFTAPTVSVATRLTFELKTLDALGASLPDSVSVSVAAPAGVGSNQAPSGTATASSAWSAQPAARANDGVPDGWPGDYTKEWSSQNGKAGSWVQINWTGNRTVNKVVLFDRPNADDQVVAGTLTFSSGASVAVGALPNTGGSLAVNFTARSVSWVRFTVTQVSAATENVGLAEFEIYGTVDQISQNLPPVAVVGANQSVATGAQVTLSGSGSYDPESAPLTYEWTQLLGPAVLNATNVANPSFTAPANSAGEDLVFELVVDDGFQTSAPMTTTVTVSATASGPNLAPLSTATASSQATQDNQGVAKAIDGVADGWPGDYTKEWSTIGGRANSWIQLNWPSARALNRVVLFDRPNANDQVLAGTLTFSDGLSVAVGTLNNTGAATSVNFTARTVTWVRFTMTQVSAATENTGLAEMQVFGPVSQTNSAPVAVVSANQTVSQGASVSLSSAGSYDPEGSSLTYTWTQTAGAAVSIAPTAANQTFVAPAAAGAQTLTFRLVVSDGTLSSTAATTTVTVSAPAAANVAPLATVSASSEGSAWDQGADKAIDGVPDGWPGDYTKEWSTVSGQANSWLQLNWSSARAVSKVVLYDRPNANDQVLAGTLTFSDGSSVAVGTLPNTGTAFEVSFASRSITWVRFTATQVSAATENIGLAEIEVY